MSCLFDSLSFFLKISSDNIRSKICDYLERNNILIEGIDTKDILLEESSNYIKNMRKSSTWGGAIEIKAAVNIWNLYIKVKNIRDKKESITDIKFIPTNGIDSQTKKIKITWNGFHYEPVQVDKNKTKQNKTKKINNEKKYKKIKYI